MPRTNATLVRAIIDTDETVNLDPYIAAANELVTEACEPLDYTDARLEMIETWLAAHIYTIFDPRAFREGVSSVDTWYQGQTKMYLDSSIYGQQAKLLDTKGGLAALQKAIETAATRPASLRWLGTTPPVNRLLN